MRTHTLPGASDFNFIMAKADDSEVFSVRGDGRLEVYGFRVTTAGQTIDNGGLTITNGGMTITENGATVQVCVLLKLVCKWQLPFGSGYGSNL